MREETLSRANSLKEAPLKSNFDDVTSLRSKISKLVSRVENAAGVNALDLAHVNVRVLDLLVDEVGLPELDPVVVDGDKLILIVVIEPNLVRSIHSNRIATDCFAACDLY